MGQIICITGQMAAGKNYICSLLENEECVSIDLDKTVHEVINENAALIYNTFKDDAEKAGLEIKNKDGTLERRKLGKLLFLNQSLLKKQEELVYPKTIEKTKEFINSNKDKTILINATLLFKTEELMNLCNAIYFVKSPLLKRIIRAKKRDGLTIPEILKRFKSQKNLLKNYKATKKPVLIIHN